MTSHAGATQPKTTRQVAAAALATACPGGHRPSPLEAAAGCHGGRPPRAENSCRPAAGTPALRGGCALRPARRGSARRHGVETREEGRRKPGIGSGRYFLDQGLQAWLRQATVFEPRPSVSKAPENARRAGQGQSQPCASLSLQIHPPRRPHGSRALAEKFLSMDALRAASVELSAVEMGGESVTPCVTGSRLTGTWRC